MTYHFIIDCEERGEFSAHVEAEDGQIIAEWDAEDCDEGFPPIVDGFMKDLDDMKGLAELLFPGRKFPPTIQKGC